MIQHNFKQGDKQWHAHRRNSRNASDAPAMMGCSAYQTRDDLLHKVATGIVGDVDEATQRRFDAGHRYEALARPLAEKIIGKELFPVVGSEGILSASFDGLTMDGTTNYEHKSLNDELRRIMVDGATGADLPLMYRVQMEQQHIVSGALKTLFMASKWLGDDLVEERHVWYTPDPELAAKIVAGWEQFEADLADYTPTTAKVQPVARPTLSLPAVTIAVEGNLALIDNLKVFGEALEIYIAGINLKPQSDQDFADLDENVKTLKRAEDSLEAEKNRALSQTTSIDTMVRTVEQYKALCKANRLMADKLFTNEKETRKAAIVLGGKDAAAKFINSKNDLLGHPYMPLIPSDFGNAIKGLKTIASIQGAVNNELARVKIEANAIADRISVNLKALGKVGDGYQGLFADKATIVLKQPEDLATLITARVKAHDDQEEARLRAQRETIRQQEEQRANEKAQAESRMAMSQIQGIQQQVMIASIGRAGVRKGGTIECIRETLAETEAWVIDLANFGAHVEMAQAAKDQAVSEIKQLLANAEAAASAAAPAPAAPQVAPPAVDAAMAQVHAVVRDATPPAKPEPTASPAPKAARSSMPELRLGQIIERIAPIQLTADGLTKLGFPPAAIERGAKLYHEADYVHICDALIDHLQKVRELQTA